VPSPGPFAGDAGRTCARKSRALGRSSPPRTADSRRLPPATRSRVLPPWPWPGPRRAALAARSIPVTRAQGESSQ
jgi:hypothetical protein